MTPTSSRTRRQTADPLSPALRSLTEHNRLPGTIVAVDQRPCPYTSSFRIDEVDLRLSSGATVPLAIKHLGRHGMVAEARPRPRFLESRTREIDAYRLVLPHAPEGSPKLLHVVTTGSGRQQLVLERVQGEPLWQVRFGLWTRVAGWIARFHASFSPTRARQLARRSDALVYDRAFYRRWLTRAMRFAAGDRVRRSAIAQLGDRYAAAIDRLVAMPQTLIHGEFYPSNVILNQQTLRVCAVDWELLSLGPGLMDLAALTAGFDTRRQRTLERAYQESLDTRNRSHGGDSVNFARDLDACRLHLAVRMLGWSARWEAPADHARDWLAEAVRISDRLDDR